MDKAVSQEIETGQLPIGKYMQIASRKVLTVNQVFDIMINYEKTHSWEHAFQAVIPKRKKAELKGEGSGEEILIQLETTQGEINCTETVGVQSENEQMIENTIDK